MNSSWHKYLPGFLRRQLEGRRGAQEALENTGWLFADRALRLIVSVFVGAWIARHLGPEQFGTWSYALAFTAIFSGFATLGLDGIVVRELARDPTKRDVLLGTTFALKLLAGAITFLVTVAAALAIHRGEFLTILLVGLSAGGFLFQSCIVVDLYFQSRTQSRYAIFAGLAAMVPVTIAKLVLLVRGAPLEAFAIVGLVEVALTGAMLVYAYGAKRNSVREWRFDLGLARKMLGESWPLLLSGFAVMVQARIDQVMLGAMAGDAELGQYSAAMRLIEVFAFVPLIITSTYAPNIARAKASDESQYRAGLTNVYRIMFIAFLVTAAPIFMFGEMIVGLLYGESYALAGTFLSLLSIRLFFANFGVAKTLYITNEGLFRYSLATTALGAAVNIVANLVLIPLYGGTGAILAMAISFGATTFVADLFVKHARANFSMMLHAIRSPHELKI